SGSGVRCVLSVIKFQPQRRRMKKKWGGGGWIIEPEEGQVLGVTAGDHPFLTLEIDLRIAETAKKTYPRYVSD
ncbi:hypothetical protein, partial [Pseudoalteromonas luteoviolacea]